MHSKEYLEEVAYNLHDEVISLCTPSSDGFFGFSYDETLPKDFM